jgi:hypothetical protein
VILARRDTQVVSFDVRFFVLLASLVSVTCESESAVMAIAP